ncbi:MAG: PEPxxWA-CTERM sorting domain-containing protein [Pseudomonadota bacterium]
MHVQAAGSAYGGSNAFFGVYAPHAGTAFISGQASPDHEEFGINGFYSFQTNSIYTVSLWATTISGFGQPASAWVDPVFTLDPLLSDNYSLAFSDGIVNAVAAVPEPSTWAMMILGFAGVGFMAYRRKAKSVQMAA